MKKTKLEREQYENRLRAQRDIITIKEEEFNKGLKEGIIETAKKMKEKGIDITIIEEITGLKKDFIEKL
jgi:predicted transposase/invertase (TIGR01784 family)